MNKNLSPVSKITILTILLWVVFGAFIHYIFWFIPLVVIFASTIAFSFYRGYIAFKKKGYEGLYEPLILVIFIFVVWLSPLSTASIYIRFYYEKDNYIHIISQIKSGSEKCNKNCIIDSSNPLRVAFPWYGAADNWYGICYDPSGKIMDANILKKDYSNIDDPKYRSVAGMYGGGLRHASHIWKEWYLCNFT